MTFAPPLLVLYYREMNGLQFPLNAQARQAAPLSLLPTLLLLKEPNFLKKPFWKSH